MRLLYLNLPGQNSKLNSVSVERDTGFIFRERTFIMMDLLNKRELSSSCRVSSSGGTGSM